MAHRHDVARPDEQMRLAEGDLALAVALRRPQHDEEGVAVLLELRPLMRAVRVLDREVVEAELVLHLVEQLLARLVQPDPDEERRIRERRRDLVAVSRVATAHALPIGGAIDDARRKSMALVHLHAAYVAALATAKRLRAPDVVGSRLFDPECRLR